MDAIDKKILSLLQKDSKLSSGDIGQMIGLSQSPTYERIKKLEKNNYIIGYHARLNPMKLHKSLLVFCELSLVKHSSHVMKEFEKSIQEINSIQECHHIAGSKDYLLKIRVKDMQEYQDVINKQLTTIPHIGQLNSSFVMNEIKNSNHIEI